MRTRRILCRIIDYESRINQARLYECLKYMVQYLVLTVIVLYYGTLRIVAAHPRNVHLRNPVVVGIYRIYSDKLYAPGAFKLPYDLKAPVSNNGYGYTRPLEQKEFIHPVRIEVSRGAGGSSRPMK